MPDSTSARVFVSYSRKDGARFAKRLREKLGKQDLSVWQDIVALEGGQDWPSPGQSSSASFGLPATVRLSPLADPVSLCTCHHRRWQLHGQGASNLMPTQRHSSVSAQQHRGPLHVAMWN